MGEVRAGMDGTRRVGRGAESSTDRGSIFYLIWPFLLTNSKTGRCWKLFPNLAPGVGANEDGAEHVQVGAKTDRQPK